MLATDREGLVEQLNQLIYDRKFAALQQELQKHEAPDLAELIIILSSDEEAVIFRLLPKELATRTFEYLPFEAQENLVKALSDKDVTHILNDMNPDDRTALLEELPGKVTRRLINLLNKTEKEVAETLLGYPKESIGRLMTPDYVAIQPTWTVREALEHIRRYGKNQETLNVIYVVAPGGKLIDDLRARELLLGELNTPIEAIMDHQYVALSAYDDQEVAVSIFRKYDRTALPVIDRDGILIGIVTVDDILDVVEEEATEDIQKLGGSEALGEPYLLISIPKMVRKRAIWLILLFLSEMLTATAMGFFEDEIASAVVLALFIPLIISSGGNSGSQAATLVTRALALGEVKLKDWWRVMRREIISGLSLGAILGSVGFLRITLWALFFKSYGAHWFLIATTIFFSLIGVVLWGTLSGSLLPILLKRLGADPAASSAPFVATLVDVTGIVIYFSVAALFLSGTLL